MQKIVVLYNVNLCAKWNFKYYFIIRNDIVNNLKYSSYTYLEQIFEKVYKIVFQAHLKSILPETNENNKIFTN